MAPQKRQRQDLGDDDGLTVQSASSGLRQDTHRKRARVSVNQSALKDRSASPRDSPSSSSDEDIPDEESVEAPLPTSTQYELLRDDSFLHLRNPELDDQRATQRFLARREVHQIGENHASDNGIIEEITCMNFMCHDRLYVVMGPLINFVVGENGSGKSALLTAITLCLGGKASATNRGSSLKSMIKSGKDQACLVVKLKNQGADAYQPDVFGESIVVERHFSTGGSSGFKLKNASGRIVSTKKGDVDDIVEYFQMQVDNPMNILTQDAAKSFITASTPAMKYQFFVKGVQLEQLDNDYRLVFETCEQIQSKLYDMESNIKLLGKAAEEAKRKAKVVQEHEGMRQAVRKWSKQMAWAQVEEQEQELADREKNVAIAQENIEEAERQLENKAQMYEGTNEAMERAEEAARQLTDELAPLKDAESEAKSAFDDARAEVEKIHRDHRSIKDHLNGAQRKVREYQRDIDLEQKRIENAHGGAHTQKLAEIEEAQRVATEARAALDRSELEYPRLEGRQQAAVDESKKAGGPIQAKRKEIESCDKRLSVLNSDRGDVMAGFDPKVPRLMQLIRNDNGFREKPVGPIGLHIKLLKPVWSDVLERSMGTILNGFVVTSKADQVRLSSMMRHIQLDWCPVLIGNNQLLDTAGHEPDPQYDTILRVLDIDNELVKSQLIINQAIEQSILVEDREAAHSIMYAGARPDNVKQSFSINVHKRGWGVRLSYSGKNNQNQATDFVRPPVGKPRMKTDVESQITYQQETLNQLRREEQDLIATQRRLQQDVQKCSQAITQHNRARESLKIDLQRAEENVERLQADLDRENVEDGRLDALKEALKEAEEEVAMYERTYGDAALEKEKLNKTSIEKKRALEAVKLLVAEHDSKIKKAQSKAKRLGQARSIALQENNVAFEVVNELKTHKKNAEDRRDRQIPVVADYIRQATLVSPRVPVDEGENAVSIDARLKTLSAAIMSYNKRIGGTDHEILTAAEEAQQLFRRAESHLGNLKELLGVLKQSFKDRVVQWRRFQRHISARSRINFGYLLSERAFRGKMTFNHVAKTLDVTVEPDETTKSSKGRVTKTLSGGEKSFSSICLLLAVWEAMGAPLRCLDEFDVFMDEVNREVSTKLIIVGARRSVGRQFILMSPKGIGAGGAENAADVKIHKLIHPREHQRRIDEMAPGGASQAA